MEKNKEINADEGKIEKKKEESPKWIKLKPKEVEKIIIELGKKGESPASIGLILRDKHGVPRAKEVGKSITEILDENKIDYLNERKHVENRIDILKKHIDANKHDYSASISLTKKLWVRYKLDNK